MKAFLLAATALAFSAAAIAQDAGQPTTTTTEQPSGETVDDPSQATGPEGITQQGTDPNGDATAPAGTNEPMAPGSGGMAAPGGQQDASTPRPAAAEYPACSRTVTDSCVQTYERGVRRARGRR